MRAIKNRKRAGAETGVGRSQTRPYRSSHAVGSTGRQPVTAAMSSTGNRAAAQATAGVKTARRMRASIACQFPGSLPYCRTRGGLCNRMTAAPPVASFRRAFDNVILFNTSLDNPWTGCHIAVWRYPR